MKNVTTENLRRSNRAEPRLTRHVLASIFSMYSVCSAVSAANLAIYGGAVETWVDSAYPRIGTLAPRCAPDPKDGQWMIGCEVLDRDFTRFAAYKDYLPKLGIRSIRLQGGWAKSEKEKGRYDFAWLDECVDFALAHGLNPVLETDYGNPVYKGGGTPDLAGGFPVSDEALDAWDRWVDALSKHFTGRVRDWAMWNEPVWVDLLTGDVRAARGSMVTCAEGVMFLNVPAYDSPCVITEHAAIDISSNQANNLTAR